MFVSCSFGLGLGLSDDCLDDISDDQVKKSLVMVLVLHRSYASGCDAVSNSSRLTSIAAAVWPLAADP